MDGVRSLLDELAARWDEHDAVGEGSYQLVLEGATRVQAYLAIQGGRATVHDGIHQAPKSTVVMPAALLTRLAAQGEEWELGGLDEDARRSIQFTGSDAFAQAFLRLTKRPPTAMARRIARAEELAAARPRLRRIERRETLAERDVVEAFRSSVPLVVVGALHRWPLGSSVFVRLARRFGHARVLANGAPATLGDVLHRMQNLPPGASVYTQGCSLPAELRHAFPPPFFSPEHLAPQLWMGATSAAEPVTRLHRDLDDMLLAQVAGRKRVLVYSPEQSPLLYPYGNFNHYQQCWVEALAPDLARHPRFAEAEAIELELGPGDLFVNPAAWFHCVQALGPTMSVSYVVRAPEVAA